MGVQGASQSGVDSKLVGDLAVGVPVVSSLSQRVPENFNVLGIRHHPFLPGEVVGSVDKAAGCAAVANAIGWEWNCGSQGLIESGASFAAILSGQQIVVVAHIKLNGCANVLYIAESLGSLGSLLGLGEDGKEDSSQDCDNRNDHQKLNESKCFSHKCTSRAGCVASPIRLESICPDPGGLYSPAGP